jgi:hypothetical protein
MADARLKAWELEDQVRAVARKIGRTRQLTVATLRVLGTALRAVAGLGCADDTLAYWLLALSLLSILVVAFVVPYLVALPIIALYRARYQLRLRRLITRIPDEQRREVLDALFSEVDETAAIVAPALKRLNLPYEVVPTAQPGGRGDEVSSR